jgi:hypothetical protein
MVLAGEYYSQHTRQTKTEFTRGLSTYNGCEAFFI